MHEHELYHTECNGTQCWDEIAFGSSYFIFNCFGVSLIFFLSLPGINTNNRMVKFLQQEKTIYVDCFFFFLCCSSWCVLLCYMRLGVMHISFNVGRISFEENEKKKKKYGRIINKYLCTYEYSVLGKWIIVTGNVFFSTIQTSAKLYAQVKIPIRPTIFIHSVKDQKYTCVPHFCVAFPASHTYIIIIINAMWIELCSFPFYNNNKNSHNLYNVMEMIVTWITVGIFLFLFLAEVSLIKHPSLDTRDWMRLLYGC